MKDSGLFFRFLIDSVGANILLGWTGFVMNERVMGGCVFSCGIHTGTNMWFRYYTPQLIWCFGVSSQA